MIEAMLKIERPNPFNDSTPLFDKQSEQCMNAKHTQIPFQLKSL